MTDRILKARDEAVFGEGGPSAYIGALERQLMLAEDDLIRLSTENAELHDKVESLEHRCDALEEALDSTS